MNNNRIPFFIGVSSFSFCFVHFCSIIFSFCFGLFQSHSVGFMCFTWRRLHCLYSFAKKSHSKKRFGKARPIKFNNTGRSVSFQCFSLYILLIRSKKSQFTRRKKTVGLTIIAFFAFLKHC